MIAPSVGNKRRNFGLDVIRATAIILVVLSHQKQGFGVLGVVAVEMFFVLSGFLIGGIFYRKIVLEDKTSPKDILEFWKRRWWRTLPNYYLFLALFLALEFFGTDTVPWDAWKAALFVQNLAGVPKTYGVSWSLAIEEWFYLTMPLLYLGFRQMVRIPRIAFLATTAVMILVPILARLTLGAGQPFFAVRYGVVYRLDAMMFGVLCAVLSEQRPALWSKMRLLGPVGVVGLVLITLANRDASDLRLIAPAATFTLYPIFAAMLLPAFAAVKTAPAAIRRPVEFFALTSYSVYLSHLLVIVVYRESIKPSLGGVVLALASLAEQVVIFGAAYLVYRYYELPMTARRGTESDNTYAAPS